MISRGRYDFAVSCVCLGIKSDKHSSLDEDAKFGGWFIEWF